jgi:hypothetical protein
LEQRAQAIVRIGEVCRQARDRDDLGNFFLKRLRLKVDMSANAVTY